MGFYHLAFDRATRLKWIHCLTSGTCSEVLDFNDTSGQNLVPKCGRQKSRYGSLFTDWNGDRQLKLKTSHTHQRAIPWARHSQASLQENISQGNK